jgi:hypothetical protein
MYGETILIVTELQKIVFSTQVRLAIAWSICGVFWFIFHRHWGKRTRTIWEIVAWIVGVAFLTAIFVGGLLNPAEEWLMEDGNHPTYPLLYKTTYLAAVAAVLVVLVWIGIRTGRGWFGGTDDREP